VETREKYTADRADSDGELPKVTPAVGVTDRPSHRLRRSPAASIPERLEEIAIELAKLPDTGLMADKAFFDEISGD